MVGKGNPATQFGAPGGPDPVEAGRKGGGKQGVSILKQMHQLMDEETANRIAAAYVRRLEAGEDVAIFKEYTSRQDGLMTQQTDMRITGDRTVVVEPGDGTVPELPGEESDA